MQGSLSSPVPAPAHTGVRMGGGTGPGGATGRAVPAAAAGVPRPGAAALRRPHRHAVPPRARLRLAAAGGEGGGDGEPKLFVIGQHDGFNEVQVAYAFHRQRRAVRVVNLRTLAPWESLAAEAAKADHVVALVAGDPRDIPYLRENFRSVPGGSEQRMNFVSEALLDRLGTEAGFTTRLAVEAPGGGSCRAVLLSRPAGSPG